MRDGVGAADDCRGQDAVELRAFEGCQGGREAIGIDRRRHRAGLAAAQRDERLLVRRESRRASSSVSAATMLTPSMTWGRPSAPTVCGLKWLR